MEERVKKFFIIGVFAVFLVYLVFLQVFLKVQNFLFLQTRVAMIAILESILVLKEV